MRRKRKADYVREGMDKAIAAIKNIRDYDSSTSTWSSALKHAVETIEQEKENTKS